MSKRIANVAVIAPEPDMICFECGKIAETRPYGRGGAEVCVDCGMKIPEIINHNMAIKLFGQSGKIAS
jgi:hypothetical protein